MMNYPMTTSFYNSLCALLIFGIIIRTSTVESENVYKSSDSTCNPESHEVKHRRLAVYIPMNEENLEKYKGSFNVGDEKILIFDIDGTLYKIKDELITAKFECCEAAYNNLRDPKVHESFKEFLDNEDKGADYKKDGIHILQRIYKKLGVTAEEFGKNMEDLNYALFVDKDQSLVNYLSQSKLRLWCLTNGFEYRARAILNKLEIEHLIEGVICVDKCKNNPTKKPHPEAYNFVEQLLGIRNNNQIHFFDDIKMNLEEAEKRGWNITYVGPENNLVCLLEDIIGKNE